MHRLLVDWIKCKSPTDASGDDIYFLVLPVYRDKVGNVSRVGPYTAWADIDADKGNSERHVDKVLVADTTDGAVYYLVAVMDEDGAYDFEGEELKLLSKAMKYLFKTAVLLEPDFGLRLKWLLMFYNGMIQGERHDDDRISTIIANPGKNTAWDFAGEGAHYAVAFKVG